MVRTTPSPSSAEVGLISLSPVMVSTSLSQVVPDAGIPSTSGSLPMISEMPTPLRNPVSTGWEIRSARKPSRATAMSSSSTATIRPRTATAPAYSGLPAAATDAAPAATSAAVAESAPTTSWREEAMSANATAGSSAQYKPVWTGRPAIVA